MILKISKWDDRNKTHLRTVTFKMSFFLGIITLYFLLLFFKVKTYSGISTNQILKCTQLFLPVSSLRITTASYPVPSICATDQIEDWFDGLANCLNWNIRQQQRPLHSWPSATSLDSLECDATNPPQKLANGD